MPGAAPIVFVLDDDVCVRESLEPLLRTRSWQVKTFASAREFLARPLPLVPCCLILDISLPDLSGIDLQMRMTADHAETPVIFITGHGDIPMAVRAMGRREGIGRAHV